MRIKPFRTLEEDIVLLQNEAKNQALSIAEILHVMSGKGRTLILILFSLPFCQPIQIPGLSVPFGLAIAFIGLRLTFGKKLWLPQQLLKKTIPSDVLHHMTEKTLNLIKKMRPWVHPRLPWLSHSSLMEKTNGLTICLLGILLALPLPIPLSNMIAAWSISLIAFGMLEDDGLFIIFGYTLSLATVLFITFALLTLNNIIYE